jgi:hypothetical protein
LSTASPGTSLTNQKLSYFFSVEGRHIVDYKEKIDKRWKFQSTQDAVFSKKVFGKNILLIEQTVVADWLFRELGHQKATLEHSSTLRFSDREV